MGKIQIMSEELANMIAAGEVIERPVSVVKELVENSIDANSTKIIINLENSGLNKITVIDNGSGMSRSDAKLSIKRHSSSKLYDINALFKIATLGFRGEALNSISSVSNLEITTCDGKESTRLVVEANQMLFEGSSSFRVGTQMVVTKLFYNTPARLKYITNLYLETAKVIEYVSKCSIANPQISFRLVNDQKVLLQTSASKDVVKTLGEVYSIDLARQVNELTFQANDYFGSIYLIKPQFQRSNKNYINVFINHRVVRNKVITDAILAAYQDYLPKNRYPFCIINLVIEPELLDVNIHPNKYEVKISKEKAIVELLTATISKFLTNTAHVVEMKHEIKAPSLDNLQLPLTRKQDVPSNINIEEPTYQANEFYVPIGQFAKTYILAQNASELIMIDQHAAMERINYEKNCDLVYQETVQLYELLVPIVIRYSLEEALIIANNLATFTQYNIEIEQFSKNSFIIRKIPTWIQQTVAKECMELIAQNIINDKQFDMISLKKDALELMSCKESLKANQYLTIKEMEVLIDRLFNANNPFFCPHGRPIVVKYELQDIEKLFKRVL